MKFTENELLKTTIKYSFEEFLKTEQDATYELFKACLYDEIKKCPDEWRKGQKIFNTVFKYLPAESKKSMIPFDCFYKEDNIDDFLKCVYLLWKNKFK